MRRHGLVLLCTLVLAAVAARAARAHSTPQIRAERAHAQAVVAEINRIGRNLEAVVQRYDGARLELQRVKRSLRRNESELRVARGNFQAAQTRLMQRIYSLYVNGQPTMVDVIAGARSISQLIDRAESAQVLSNQDAALGQQALRFERAVQRRERQLQRLKLRRETTVAGLAAQRRTIQSALGRQQRLLASIHTTIRQLQAQEAARERRRRRRLSRRSRRRRPRLRRRLRGSFRPRRPPRYPCRAPRRGIRRPPRSRSATSASPTSGAGRARAASTAQGS